MDKDFNFMCIINDDKWNKLNNTKYLIDLADTNELLNIKEIKIKNPDNPAQLRGAKLITFAR